MNQRTLAVIVLLGLATRAHADTPDHHRLTHLLLGAGAIGAFAISETVLKNSIAPPHCRWCATNSLDTGVRDALVWSNPGTAATISNITGYVMPAVSAAGLLLASSRNGDQLLDDLIPELEAGAYGQLVVQGIKYSVGRQRPYAHFAGPGFVPTEEDNLSFLSGHTSLAFSVAVSAGMVAHRRHYKYEAAIWASGIGFSTLTAYLRIAADKHYFTDVASGAALGVAAGLFIPQLTGSLPHEVAIVPTMNGAAVVGTF
jgi:membrane-associated phospholipid phosphatase